MKIVKLLLGLSPFLVLLPIAALLVRRHQLSPPLRWIGAYLLLCALTGFVSFALWLMKTNNLWVLHFQTAIELPLLFFALYSAIGNARAKYFTVIVAAAFVLFSVINSLYIQSVSRYNSYAQTIGSLLIIGYCIHYFTELIRKMQVKNLFATPMFWIVSSIFFYYASSLFLFALGNAFISRPLWIDPWIWMFHVFIAAVYYIVMTIGLWKSKAT